MAPQDGGPVLLIAGGSGIVPLIAMIRARHLAASDAPFLLLYASRTRDELLYREDLIAGSEGSGAILLRFALSRDAASDPLTFNRRIDADMIRDCIDALPAAPLRVYCCGSNGFVNAATDAAIAAGVAPERIRTERFGG